MRIYLNSMLSMNFPMTAFELQDALDRLGVPQDKPIVRFRILKYDNMNLPQCLCGREFSTDIYKLNLFTERYEKLKFAEKAAMKSLLISNPESSFDEILLMTYGLNSVPVWPCESCFDLGEMIIENQMMPELESCSDEVLELLDREHIGKIMCERNGGMFVDMVYCEPACYEPPDINIEIGKAEKCFFRLLVAPPPADDKPTENMAQWVSLPCPREQLDGLAKSFDTNIEDMVYYDFQSALPQITDESFGNMNEIDELNALAEKLSTLTHSDFIKLKAVMESQDFREISDAAECLNCLDGYGFVVNIFNESEFGKEYLSRNLPTNFDLSVLEDIDLHDFGSKILSYKGSQATSYGIICGRNMDLFSAITVQPEQEIEEEVDEAFEMEMGDMSL